MTKGRTRYLVSYDICNPKRLRNVHRVVSDFGYPMQYSVFICDLDAIELIWLKEEVGDVMNHGEDSVAFINLGPPEERGSRCFSFLGIAKTLPVSGPIIV